MTYKVLFSGNDFRNVDRKLRDFDKIIGAEIMGAGNKALANRAAEEARSIVRVKTGKTKRSIRVVEGTGPRRGRPIYVIAGTQEHRAALFLELGTVKMQPYPFLRPALGRASRSGFRRYIEAAKRAFRRTIGRLVGRR